MPRITLWLCVVWSHSVRHNPSILCCRWSRWAPIVWVICNFVLQTVFPLALSTDSCHPSLKTASHNSHFALWLDVLPSKRTRREHRRNREPAITHSSHQPGHQHLAGWYLLFTFVVTPNEKIFLVIVALRFYGLQKTLMNLEAFVSNWIKAKFLKGLN